MAQTVHSNCSACTHCARSRWPLLPSDAGTRNDIRAQGLVAHAPSTPVQSIDCPAFAHARDGQLRRYSLIDRSRRRLLTLRRALSIHYKSLGWPGPRAALSTTTNATAEPKIWSNHIGNRCRETPLHAKQCRRANPTRLVGLAPHLCSQSCHSTCTHAQSIHSQWLCLLHHVCCPPSSHPVCETCRRQQHCGTRQCHSHGASEASTHKDT